MRRTFLPIFGLLALGSLALPALAAPVTVTITGPASVTVPYGCQNVTFTGSATGGTPPYVLYAWTKNGASVGTNSATLVLTYCSVQGQFSQFNDTIGLTVTDSNGREGSKTKTLTVILEGCDSRGNNCAG
ncbi:MAG: hypothetical protein U0002_13120 [Thermoanaerobaculia bacterium]